MTRRPATRHQPPRLATTRRVILVLAVLLRAGAESAVSAAGTRLRWLSRWRWSARVIRVSPPERLRETFERLGGAFLKFGQMLALQPDVLPIAYCNALFDLLDRVPPAPFEDLEQVFLEDLGRSVHDEFETIDRTPVASASIGQVYVARLGSRRVAVKVQRLSARAQFTSDIRLMAIAIRVVEWAHLSWFNWLLEPMTEFVGWTNEELDYRSEARYMERLRRNAGGRPHERVPRVFQAYVTPRILVAEFLEGETVLGYLRRRESAHDAAVSPAVRGFDAPSLARNIIDNFLGDVFEHGMFHADLHPANLMILPDNVVGYIDFGITGVMSRYSRESIVALTLAYTRGDLNAMCAAFFRVSTIDDATAPERFRAGLVAASRHWYTDAVGGRRLRKNFTLVMLDMLRLSRETRVLPARDVIKYIRSAIAIDGLITRLVPAFDVRAHLENVCARHLTVERSASAVLQEAYAAATRGVQLWQRSGLQAAGLIDEIARGNVPLRLELDPPVRTARGNGTAVAAVCAAALGLSLLRWPQTDASPVIAGLPIAACLMAVVAHGMFRARRKRIRL